MDSLFRHDQIRYRSDYLKWNHVSHLISSSDFRIRVIPDFKWVWGISWFAWLLNINIGELIQQHVPIVLYVERNGWDAEAKYTSLSRSFPCKRQSTLPNCLERIQLSTNAPVVSPLKWPQLRQSDSKPRVCILNRNRVQIKRHRCREGEGEGGTEGRCPKICATGLQHADCDWLLPIAGHAQPYPCPSCCLYDIRQ